MAMSYCHAHFFEDKVPFGNIIHTSISLKITVFVKSGYCFSKFLHIQQMKFSQIPGVSLFFCFNFVLL